MAHDHLAWHETLEIHELVAFQSIFLLKLKKALPEVSNKELNKLYQESIQGLTTNLMELLSFYPDMPRAEGDAVLEGFLAGDLLAVWKAAVRNYSIAITETATPSVRKVLKKQLNSAIDMHAKVFHFMEKTGKYPAYDLEKLLAGDVSLARKALK